LFEKMTLKITTCGLYPTHTSEEKKAKKKRGGLGKEEKLRVSYHSASLAQGTKTW
jgi:hypothetical protein